MRRNRLLLLLAPLAAVALPSVAHAQTDVAPPLPNVLILLDTSGSMERKPDGTLPAVPVGTVSTTEKNRWIQALEVLGGSIKGYRMLAVQRSGVSGTDFFNEYNLNGTAPYDGDYYLPHFRPFSTVTTKTCTIGAKTLTNTKTWPDDWKTWGVSDFGFRQLTGSTLGTVGSCGPADFDTDHLGVLDTFRDQARFGLMTFDTLPDPKTGWTGTSHLGQESNGMLGQWSYYPGWNATAGASPAYAWPAGCAVDATTKDQHLFELGARNPAAPPWEGPLVPFASDDSATSLRSVNDRIRYAMLAARPYGATPLGPMLSDAQWYLQSDPNGPKSDPLTDCRGSFIIVITDGFPNSDMRPSCEDSTSPKSPPTQVYNDPVSGCSSFAKGCCPAKRPQDITYDLQHPPAGKQPVATFVVGFAVSDDTGKDVHCELVDPVTCMTSPPAPGDPKAPCCTLHEMAANGGTGKALFANDTDTLRAALIKAMSDATSKSSTSRTYPVFTAASGAGQYEFHSSFNVNAFSAWSGVLGRQRWECPKTGGGFAVAQTPDSSLGDDFAQNLNKQITRRFWTVDSSSTTTPTDGTLRPNITSADFDGMNPTTAPIVDSTGATFVSSMTAAALKIAPTGCGADATTADECKQKLLNYALALSQPKATWLSRVGNAMGDIYHATPVGVFPPSEFLRDESYTDFRNKNSKRQPIMLTATNDGLLHAFKADVTSNADANFELWSFIPPAVLPNIGKQYGGAHALLLDAAPIVKDVPFGPATSTIPWGRTANDAKGGQANWRTVAVGALTTGRGFYALDVTDPAKPKFLWQITNIVDGAGNAYDLFGAVPGTPAIGTVYYSDGGGAPVETPVAFLPGGEGVLSKSGTCARWVSPSSASDPATTFRNKVRCWVGSGLSFTIVRLWDGKILRSFRNDPAGSKTADHPAETNNPAIAFNAAGKGAIVTSSKGATSGGYAGIDSPLTGAVALYPATAGTVTVRAFVGDADGTLWKLDVSDVDPANWTFGIFHDAYYPADPDNANPAVWGPIAVSPVISVDSFNDIVVNYGTGDQNSFSSTTVNHVFSITERSTSTSVGKTFAPKLNWHVKLPSGVTPTGPMSLFNSTLYYSTFSPNVASASACLSGQAAVWAVDYLQTAAGLANADGTPLPRGGWQATTSADATIAGGTCPDGFTNTTGGAFYRCNVLLPPSIVFGTGITQRPSCVDTASSSIGSDPYVGTSSPHMTVNNINTGDFYLVAQTGQKTSDKAGNTTTSIGGTNVFTKKLQAPNSLTRIDSWAAIVE